MEAAHIAARNFASHLRDNPYPGRGFVIGRSSIDPGWVMLYWIMGRSAHSRNRRFVAEGGTLRTAPVDPQLLTDPSLIIYEAMLELPGLYLVSNGAQTRAMYETLSADGTFERPWHNGSTNPMPPTIRPVLVRCSGSHSRK